MPSNANAEARPQAVALTGPRTWGVTFRGLNAALTGAVSTAVARFEAPPTATTRRLSGVIPPASSALADPVTVVTTAADGTTFAIQRRGLWAIDVTSGALSLVGANALLAVLSVDAIAADLVVATTPTNKDGDRNLDAANAVTTAGAGLTVPFKLRGEVCVYDDVRPVVRVLLSNGGGVVPTAGSVNLAGTSISFTWLRDRA